MTKAELKELEPKVLKVAETVRILEEDMKKAFDNANGQPIHPDLLAELTKRAEDVKMDAWNILNGPFAGVRDSMIKNLNHNLKVLRNL